jgi:hypothetical protein
VAIARTNELALTKPAITKPEINSAQKADDQTAVFVSGSRASEVPNPPSARVVVKRKTGIVKE